MPFVEPWARLIAVTTPSTADGPVMNPPVAALTCLASVLTALLGSSPNDDATGTNIRWTAKRARECDPVSVFARLPCRPAPHYPPPPPLFFCSGVLFPTD